MSRIKDYELSKEEKNLLLKKFFICVASLRDYQVVSDFFKDLLNSEETIMLARRLKAAQMIEQGLTYEQVSQRLRMGKDTIAKINFWLKYGRGGYMKAVHKLNKKERKEESKRIRRAKLDKPFDICWIQEKYGIVSLDDLVEIKDEIEEFITYQRAKRKSKKIKNEL